MARRLRGGGDRRGPRRGFGYGRRMINYGHGCSTISSVALKSEFAYLRRQGVATAGGHLTATSRWPYRNGLNRVTVSPTAQPRARARRECVIRSNSIQGNHMKRLLRTLATVAMAIGLACLPPAVQPLHAADAKPDAGKTVKKIKVLLVIGGCCHVYGRQKQILEKGISERAPVEFT